MKLSFALIVLLIGLFFSFYTFSVYAEESTAFESLANKSKFELQVSKSLELQESSEKVIHPLQIKVLRERTYPGSQLRIEEELLPHTNYRRYIASYKSQGATIYGLLTVPTESMPVNGWPIILVNHGYIPPADYKTTSQYGPSQHGLASAGYVTFKSDYRGHGSSQGSADSGYFSPGYLVDILNAVASVKTLEYVNPNKIGMWGHSMGGHLTLKAMVISKEIDAGVVWGGVVSSYNDIINNWVSEASWWEQVKNTAATGVTNSSNIDKQIEQEFWNTISPTTFVKDISGPIQIHHGTADSEVPWQFSERLAQYLSDANVEYEYFLYEGADHNFTGAVFDEVMARTVVFFDKHLAN